MNQSPLKLFNHADIIIQKKCSVSSIDGRMYKQPNQGQTNESNYTSLNTKSQEQFRKTTIATANTTLRQMNTNCSLSPLNEEQKNDQIHKSQKKINFVNQYSTQRVLRESKEFQVALCKNRETGELKISKIFFGSHFTDNDFLSEIEINQILVSHKHKNILIVDKIIQEDKITVLLFKNLEGGTLYDFMADRHFKLSFKEIKLIMRQLLKALVHLHSIGIMHRDLKLDNILFEEKNNVRSLKIIDFGCSSTFDNQITRKMKCGTPGYIAPEVYTNNEYNEKCDIYSIGAIFHILLSGTRLYPSNIECKNQYKISSNIKCQGSLDLLKYMLQDAKYRPTAKECLCHPFFLQKEFAIIEENNIQKQIASMTFPQFKNPFSQN